MLLMTHFAPAWVASNSKQMDPSHSMKMGNLSGDDMFHILTQLPPASVFTNSAENSGLLTVICEGVFFFPLSSSVDVTSPSDRDLCSVFKEESLSQQQEEQGDTRSPPYHQGSVLEHQTTVFLDFLTVKEERNLFRLPHLLLASDQRAFNFSQCRVKMADNYSEKNQRRNRSSVPE